MSKKFCRVKGALTFVQDKKCDYEICVNKIAGHYTAIYVHAGYMNYFIHLSKLEPNATFPDEIVMFEI